MTQNSLPKTGDYHNPTYWKQIHNVARGELNAVGYAGLGEGFNMAAYKIRLRAVEQVLRRRQVAPGRILEAAVGVGAYAPLWGRMKVGSWTGIDISPVAIADLSVRYPHACFHVVDLTQPWPVPAGIGEAFDLVTAIDVLYHLVDDDAFATAVANLAAVVRAGGYFLVSDVFCDTDRQISPHVKRRAMENYEGILSKLGFVRVERQAVFAILADPVIRKNRPIADVALFTIWRTLSKLITITPRFARNCVGKALATALTPADALLKRAGVAKNVNLELALFQRVPVNR